MRASRAALLAFFAAACSSPSTSPLPGGDAGEPVENGQGGDAAGPGPTGAPDAAPPQGGDDASSTTGGMRCYVTSGGCICLDPAPQGYTATVCPPSPCCWKDTTRSPMECACAAFQGSQCDAWRSGPAVPSCP